MRLYTLDGRFNLCGKRVREARIKAGMSQDTLAAKLQLAWASDWADGSEQN